MEFSNTYDEKIMNFNGDNWEEFVALFTDEEVEQMAQSYLIVNCYKDTKESIIDAYLEEWAVEQIRNRTVYGTEHLLRLLYAFGA